MEIIRHDDGTLVVPNEPTRQRSDDETASTEASTAETPPVATTRLLHPGEGGYDEALAQWDAEQDPDRGPAVSTAAGREEAMALVSAVAASPDAGVATAVADLDDPDGAAEALRHVLAGGPHSVEDFASEVATAEGSEPLPAHQATKVIGEVLAQLD